jgi:hypothetical protein
MQADENETQNAINPEVKNVVSNGNKHLKETNEKKEKDIESAVECETGRTYFCQAARMKMAEKATRPMKDRKPMQRRLTTPTKPPTAADSLFQHTRTTKEIIEVDKKCKYVLRCLCPSLSQSLSLSLSHTLSSSFSCSRARASERERSGKTSILATATAAAAELQTKAMDWGGCFFQATQDSNPRPCQRKSHRGTDLFIYLFIGQVANLSVFFMAKPRNLAICFSEN